MDHSPFTGAPGRAPELDLSAFVLDAVRRATSEEALRARVEKRIADTVDEAVASAMRCYGNVGRQIEKAVASALELREPIDVPAYGAMVLAVLRGKMDEVLTAHVQDHLAKQMEAILAIAPKEVKLSAIVEAMKEAEDEGERYGTHCTVLVEGSDNVEGYYSIFLDPQPLSDALSRYSSKRSKYDCEARFSIDAEGKIYAATIDRKDAAQTVVMGYLPKWQKMIYSAYASGSKILLDEGTDGYDTGFGDI